MSAPALPEKPVTVTLGELTKVARARVASGRYASMSEVVRAGLRALEREEQALDAVIAARVAEALADSQPPVPMDQVFADLRAHHAARIRDETAGFHGIDDIGG